MRFSEVNDMCETGDILLFRGKGFISGLIRMITGESVSHVEMIVKEENGMLWSYGFREKGGYFAEPLVQLIRTSLAKEYLVWYGKGPKEIRSSDIIQKEIKDYKDIPEEKKKYAWYALPVILLAQLTGQNLDTGNVCSTFIQRMWEKAGYVFERTPDPGDFFYLCQNIIPITEG